MRDLTRVQHLCRTCWFGFVLPSQLTVRFLGCVLVEKFTANRDRRLKGRKLPIILGGVIQLGCLLALLYIPQVGTALGIILCFIFGFANAAHMLAFSTAADVVRPNQIGTSAAIVNGIMFIVGGIMISRPGVRIGMGIEAGIEPKSLEIAQYASLPLLAALVIALALSFFMKETYPRS